MNIYFSCSITGGRDDQHIYQAIVDTLLRDGHTIPTAHLSFANVMEKETVVHSDEVYTRDVLWVKECDALIAEVSTPSHGVGYEIALGLFLHKPVLCVFQYGRRVSKMITGNDSPTLHIYAYRSFEDLMPAMNNFLSSIN